MFAQSLIWRLLTNSGSLWVAWTKFYLLRSHIFWDVSDRYAGSWIWQKLLKLRDLTASFLRYEIGNGHTALFWFDNWSSAGRLINITGDTGTQVLRIPRYATVSRAASAGQWNFRRCRGCHLWAMIATITLVPAPVDTASDDRYVWRHGEDEFKPCFSSLKTWK